MPGANDGASGVAVLLGVADVLKRHPPTIGVDLLFDDGEDYGDFNQHPNDVLIGARYYAAHQPPGPQPKYAVLFDLVADKDLQIYQEGNSLTGAPEIVNLVWGVARKAGHQDVFIDAPKHTLTDDHVELQKVGIKAIDVVDFDYPSWHTPDDTIDKVSAASLQIVGDVAVALVRAGEVTQLSAPIRRERVAGLASRGATVPACLPPNAAPSSSCFRWPSPATRLGSSPAAPVRLPGRSSWSRRCRGNLPWPIRTAPSP